MKLRKSKLTVDEIVKAYTESLLSLNEIGIKAGISKSAVGNIIKAAGVAYRGGEVKRVCKYCGSEFTALRCRIKRGTAVYCSNGCFHADRSMHGDMSVSSRFGRAALAGLGIQLLPGQVVHHIDGNRLNNAPDNLQVFDNQKEHMKFHHSLRLAK